MAAAEEKALIPIETRALAQFDVTPEAVAEKVKEYENLHVTPGDKKSYKQVHAAYMVIVHLRNGVDKRRKDLGEEARKWTNALSAAAKKLLDPTVPLENRFSAELAAEDARIAVEKAEKERLEKERLDRIKAKIMEIHKKCLSSPLDTSLEELREIHISIFEMEITKDEFGEYLDDAQNAQVHGLQLLKVAMETREARDREDANLKAEAERIEKIRKEQEAERKRLDEEKAKLEEEKAKIIAEKKAEEARERQEEREAIERQEKATREALEKDEKERKLKEAVEYAERMQPDKKKIISYAHGIIDRVRPEIKEEPAKAMFELAISQLKSWADEVIYNAEKL